MNNYSPLSNLKQHSCQKPHAWTIFTVAFTLIIICLVPPCYSKEKNTSEILRQANLNVEKYRKADAAISFHKKTGEPVKNTTVIIEQKTHDFLFGNIIFPLIGVLEKYDREIYRPKLFQKRFKDVFNFAIFPFYWSSYEKTPARPEWRKLIPVLQWCKENGITAKGHPLAWVEKGGTPTWLYDLPTKLAEELLKARITRIAKGFKDQIDIWDVVNEPTHTITWSEVMEKPYGQRYTSIPIKKIADWVEKCYRWAHQANPQATLIMNDYEQIVSDFIPDTRQRFYDLAAELKERGTPLNGLGLQAHAKEYWYSPKEIWDTLNFYEKLGYPLHITEFIPQSSGNNIKGNSKKGKWTKQAQAEFAEQFYRVCFGHPAVVSINWWGLSDRYIWSERPGGGLIDENYQPKPAYNKIENLIKKEWMTKLSMKTNDDGLINFRGFYGNYKITLKTKNGAVYTFNIHLDKNEANKWNFKL